MRDTYKKQIKWTKDFFVDSGLKDYLFYKCCLNESTIKSVLRKLNKHKDIKMKFYETIIYQDFPETKAYQFLIQLQENPKNAIELLKLYSSNTK